MDYRNPMAVGLLLAIGTMVCPDEAFAQRKAFNIAAQPVITGLRELAAQGNTQILTQEATTKGRRINAVRGNLTVEQAITAALRDTGLTFTTADHRTYIVTPADRLQTASTRPSESYDQNPEIIVTGSRIARPAESSPGTAPTVSVGTDRVRLSGSPNMERLLSQLPQVTGSQRGSQFGNQTPNGSYAEVNLRGFGATRNLVLVNGRRFTIVDATLITDLNTVPTSLIERTEIVTGGSSAVYGSDAITGVVNFILKDDFEGFELRPQMNLNSISDSHTSSVDLTAGFNFASGRGNVTLSGNYLKRDPVLRSQRGDYAVWSLFDGCIIPGSGGRNRPGTPLSVPAGQTCLGAGGEQGFINSGSTTVPNGIISGIPSFGGSNAELNAAYAAAGLTGIGSLGFIFNDAGTDGRPVNNPGDFYNTTPENYLSQPQKRYMFNGFAHYDLSDAITLFTEQHFSRNEVTARLAPNGGSGLTMLDVDNPYVSPALREVFRQLDMAETGPRSATAGSLTTTTTPNDGRVIVNLAKRFLDIGARVGTDRRHSYRGVWGARGSLDSATDRFLTDLRYEFYYSYANTKDRLVLQNAYSKSALQRNLLSVGGAAPVCNIFGRNASRECLDSITVPASSRYSATQQVVQGNVAGNLLSLPAGPAGFSLGVEYRRTGASFTPDAGLASGDISGYDPGLPTSGTVSAREFFGEIRVPLMRDVPLIEQLTLNGGFRVSDYSLKGIGTAWTYLAGVEWRVSRDISFRTQFQRAIRAPNIQELYGGQSAGAVPGIDPCSSRAPASRQTEDVRALCIATGVPADSVFNAVVQPTGNLLAITGGNAGLAAEVSDTFTVGTVITPRFASGLSLTVDYYNIRLDGAIASLGGGAQNLYNLCYYTLKDASGAYCKAIIRNPATGEAGGTQGAAAYLLSANTGQLKTRGFDLALKYSIDLAGLGAGGSRLSLESNFNWLQEYTVTPVAAIPSIRNECAGAYGSTCGSTFPRWRGISRVTWTLSDISLSLGHRFVGSAITDRYLVPLRQGGTPTPLAVITNPKLPARHYIDLSFDYRIIKRIAIFGGANNVFNTRIPIGTNGAVYPTIHDVLGTEFFLGARLQF
ncbi:TonB-dependent Receptor Plug Domain [Sphingobium sp. AP50]|uniref:TonB-dependent receptor n=1 Tax=Sphingobium sp. AP50 TaxID=1884369 RepID=UPI0008B7B7AF|nr:TonB-dependent receptor [Sphingobium sp. AP50]SEJ73523.1 TonB-dependent Receptor Plug Domain [Sphingobium sp. AP50]